jgi:hypothetical protein
MKSCKIVGRVVETLSWVVMRGTDNPWGIDRVHKPASQFFGLWLSTSALPAIKRTQFSLWAQSLRFFHPTSRVYLFSLVGPGAIPDHLGGTRSIEEHVLQVHLESPAELLRHTPAENLTVQAGTPYPQLSDLLRLAMLYRWGGSWIDLDDLCVRPVTSDLNVIGIIEWPGRRNDTVYFGHHFDLLIPPEWVSPQHPLAYTGGFNVGNDPMINWRPGNRFLHAWLHEAAKAGGASYMSWGQVLPTFLLSRGKGATWLRSGEVQLQGQHYMLLHPAYGCRPDCNIKGPMFPPHDLRAMDLPHYDSLLSEGAFWQLMERLLKLHSFFVVKNSKETGLRQAQSGNEQRWFTGWLGDPTRFATTLRRLRVLWLKTAAQQSIAVRTPSDFVLLQPAHGGLPSGWTVYNPSLMRLSRGSWLKLCRGLGDHPLCAEAFDADTTHGDGAMAMSWFGRAPGNSMGCAIYMGVARLDAVRHLVGTTTTRTARSQSSPDFWLLTPRLLHNVLGPKLADPRLFMASLPDSTLPGLADGTTTADSLALVGYARLGPTSSVPGMADYFVRASPIVGRPPRQLTCPNVSRSSSWCKFPPVGAETGQCYTASRRFTCCAESLALPPFRGRPAWMTGELHLPCHSAQQQGVHYCGHSVDSMDGRHLELNGIEVPLHPSSTPPGIGHTPAKNVMPVIGVGRLPLGVVLFVDFAPREPHAMKTLLPPLMVATDMRSGKALRRWRLHLEPQCEELVGGVWRGSTQVVPLHDARAGPRRASGLRRVRGTEIRSAPFDEDLWVTLLHRRCSTEPCKSLYSYAVVILASVPTEIPQAGNESVNTSLQIPLACVHMIPLPLPSARRLEENPRFAFAMGLAAMAPAVSDQRLANVGAEWHLAASWGLSDKLPAFSWLVLAPPEDDEGHHTP